MSPILPTELLFEVYLFLFPSNYRDSYELHFYPKESDFQKPRWRDIQNLTLVSKQSREFALSLWFHVVRIEDENVWNDTHWETCSLPFRYARIIHYSNQSYKTPAQFLSKFTRLHTLRIDFPPTHLTEIGTDSDIAAPQLEDIFCDAIPPQTPSEDDNTQPLPCITHLVIHGITWLEPSAMSNLSRYFPSLKSLTLKQPFVWCGACNTIGNPEFIDFLSAPKRHKAIELVYKDSDCKGLPSAYVKYMLPLKDLHTIKFSVACGIGSPWYEDLFRTSHPDPSTSRIPQPQPNESLKSISLHPPELTLRDYEPQGPPSLHLHQVTNLPPKRKDETLRLYGWSGECQDCLIQLDSDLEFRAAWNERRESFYAAEKTAVLPALRRVEWELLELTHVNWPMLL